MAGNTSTKKQYSGNREMPVNKVAPTRMATTPNRPAVYDGQLSGLDKQAFADPMNMGAPAKIAGLDGLYNDIGEMSGFITDGYLDKSHTPYGEAAKFNFLPPGMDIDNQQNAEINQMAMHSYMGGESYPGDGWMPKPRDVKE